MGIDIRLQDERGTVIDEVGDPHNIVPRLLPAFDDTSYHVVNMIDPYGDTVLNGLQMTPFLAEWERIADKALSAEAQELHARVKQLAITCQHEVHTYLKFIGD